MYKQETSKRECAGAHSTQMRCDPCDVWTGYYRTTTGHKRGMMNDTRGRQCADGRGAQTRCNAHRTRGVQSTSLLGTA